MSFPTHAQSEWSTSLLQQEFTFGCIQVATALLVASSTPTFWILQFVSTRTQALFKALGCSYNCRRRLTYCSFQLTHMSRDHAVQLNEPWRPNEDRTLQRSQHCHKGEFRHVSINTRERSLRGGQNLRGPFLRATLAMTVGSCARAMADNGKTKGFIPPPQRCVSAQLLYVCVTA